MAKPIKTSFWLDPVSDGILRARDRLPDAPPTRGQRSIMMRAILRRYDEVCQEMVPKLSKQDWELLYQAGQAWSAPASGGTTVLLVSLLEEVKRAPEQPRLLKSLLALTPAERVAVLDAVERHWAAAAKPPEATTGRRSGKAERGSS